MSELLNMGGYAEFIWPAYGVTVLGFAGILVFTLRAYANAKTRLAALEKS